LLKLDVDAATGQVLKVRRKTSDKGKLAQEPSK
jgi:hypothetical protein